MSSIDVTERRFDPDAREIAPDLNEAMRRRIAARLRDLYAPVAEEALPNAHVDLLLALRADQQQVQEHEHHEEEDEDWIHLPSLLAGCLNRPGPLLRRGREVDGNAHAAAKR